MLHVCIIWLDLDTGGPVPLLALVPLSGKLPGSSALGRARLATGVTASRQGLRALATDPAERTGSTCNGASAGPFWGMDPCSVSTSGGASMWAPLPAMTSGL